MHPSFSFFSLASTSASGGVQFVRTLKAGYNLSYQYADNQQQIRNIADSNYRYAEGESQEATIKTQQYSYDANGNILCINTGLKTADVKSQSTHTRKLLWDEENRLLELSDNGYVSNYWYDAAGERTVKQSGDGEGVNVNGVLSGARTGTSRFTAYVSPYTVVGNGGQMSKHIYMGSQRIVSKLVNAGAMDDPTKDTTANEKDFSARYAELTAKVKDRYDSLGVAYRGRDKAGVGFYTANASTDKETQQYFYHSDHLGSSSLITDVDGNVTQHIEYIPFGEVFVEERNNTWSTPYKFNAKELDEETGLYYYGARYYDPKTSVWLGVDPLAEKKPNFTSYNYCSNNPINRIDPDGRNDFGLDTKTGQLSLINKTNAETDIIIPGRFDIKSSNNISKEDGTSKNSVFTPEKDSRSLELSKGVLPDAEQISSIETLIGKRLDLSANRLNFESASEGIQVMKFISFKSHKELKGYGYLNDGLMNMVIMPWNNNTMTSAKGHFNKLSLMEKNNLSFSIHTHPGSYSGDFANGLYGYGIPSEENDVKNAKMYKNNVNHYILSKYDGFTRFFKNGRYIKNTGISW